MKILKDSIDRKKRFGSLELIPESPDDIYMLYNFLNRNDIIKTMTTRKILIEGKDSRKVSLLMDISIQEMEIDLAGGVIFIKGLIQSEHDNVRIGSFHSIDIEIGKRLKVIKNFWSDFDLKVMEDMKKIVYSVLFCIFYDSECLIFNVSRNFVKLVQKIQIKPKNVKPLCDYLSKHITNIKAVVICTFREEKPSILSQINKSKDLLKYNNLFCEVKLEETKKKTLPTKLISSILTDEKHRNLIEKIELKEEFEEMKTFLTNLEVNQSKIAIGINEIEEALDYGALKILLITYEKAKSNNLEERKNIENLILKINQIRGSVCILPANSVFGEKLSELGGIVANLKFSFK